MDEEEALEDLNGLSARMDELQEELDEELRRLGFEVVMWGAFTVFIWMILATFSFVLFFTGQYAGAAFSFAATGATAWVTYDVLVKTDWKENLARWYNG